MSKPEKSQDAVVSEKRERVPIHASRNVISIPGLDRENFYYRWIGIANAEHVQRYIDAGYSFVNKTGKQVVGDKNVFSTEGFGSMFTKTGNDGKTLGLVALPLPIYEADQKVKREENQELLETQFRSLRDQADPRNGGFGHIGEHPGSASPGIAQRTRKI